MVVRCNFMVDLFRVISELLRKVFPERSRFLILLHLQCIGAGVNRLVKFDGCFVRNFWMDANIYRSLNAATATKRRFGFMLMDNLTNMFFFCFLMLIVYKSNSLKTFIVRMEVFIIAYFKIKYVAFGIK